MHNTNRFNWVGDKKLGDSTDNTQHATDYSSWAKDIAYLMRISYTITLQIQLNTVSLWHYAMCASVWKFVKRRIKEWAKLIFCWLHHHSQSWKPWPMVSMHIAPIIFDLWLNHYCWPLLISLFTCSITGLGLLDLIFFFEKHCYTGLPVHSYQNVCDSCSFTLVNGIEQALWSKS